MKITYYGHSCFTLESDGYVIALDPYDSGVPGYGDLKLSANKVYCSHGHMDHAYTDAVEIVPAKRPSPFEVTELELPHDDANGAKRGFTFIRLFKAEGKTVVHYGDLGCPLTERAEELFKNADAALVPVGGFFTIDAAQAKAMADAIGARVVIPMHYRGEGFGYDVIGPVEAFTKLCDTVKEYGDTIEVDENTEPQTAVLARRLGI
jgi:L-ascorbate metabolism protein UlaG (beta-lactamase superfamily)